jgi:hypothetical protein
VALALACATPAHAAPGSRPFKASLDLDQRSGRSTVCLGPQGQPGTAGQLSGTGHATHLGAVQFAGFHCLSFRLNQPTNVTNGTMTMTAASGDTLRADYSGLISLVSPGVYAFEGNYFIVEGTGRFQEASGSGALFGTLQGEFAPTGQPFSLTADGRIGY